MPDIDKHVDPALWPLVEAFPPIDLSDATLAGFRGAMVALSVRPDPASHADISITEVIASEVRCLLFQPVTRVTSAGALLHIHGGGFVMGMPEMDLARNIEIVRATGCTILSVDYRLAPEYSHPAGLEDCHAALLWLAAQQESLGFAPGRIGVIGESAGGGLAASVALLARDRQSVALTCQILVYPMLLPPARSLDATVRDGRTGRYIWTRNSDAWTWSANLGGNAVDENTIAGLASDQSRLPATFIAVGDLDLFVHDNLAHASRLLAAGCPVEAHVYPGAIHGFDRMVDAPVAVRFTRDLVDFIKRHLG